MPRVKLFDEKEVLSQAMNLFWKQGYAATSIQDLVNHLGINRASIYDTFGGKHELFQRAFSLYRAQNLAGISSFFDSHPDVQKGLRLLFETAIDQAMTDPDRKGCFVVNTVTELVPNDPEMDPIIAQNKDDYEAQFAKYLQAGKDSGQLSQSLDVESTASLLYLVYNGLRVVSKVNPNRQELLNSVKLALTVVGC
jgi:TetR/AcrR family transcriptional repressor of nem operon